MSIQLLGTRLLVIPDPAQTKIGSFVLPSSEQPTQGTVAFVGPGTKDEEMIVKQGDHVLYGEYVGTNVTVVIPTQTVGFYNLLFISLCFSAFYTGILQIKLIK